MTEAPKELRTNHQHLMTEAPIEAAFCGVGECHILAFQVSLAGHLRYSKSGSSGLTTIDDGRTGVRRPCHLSMLACHHHASSVDSHSTNRPRRAGDMTLLVANRLIVTTQNDKSVTVILILR